MTLLHKHFINNLGQQALLDYLDQSYERKEYAYQWKTSRVENTDFTVTSILYMCRFLSVEGGVIHFTFSLHAYSQALLEATGRTTFPL